MYDAYPGEWIVMLVCAVIVLGGIAWQLWSTLLRPGLSSCDHDTLCLNVTELEPLGVSLGWSCRPVLIRQWRKDCPICGERVVSSGYLPNDNVPRDSNFWPLKPSGERYPMVSFI